MSDSVVASALPPLTLPSATTAVRDFAFVGAVTGFAAPFAVTHLMSLGASYCVGASVGGALGGALLGLFSRWFLKGAGRRWPKGALLPLGGLLGALWGACAGLGTYPVTGTTHGILTLSVLTAAVAGAFQGGWFWLTYWYRRVNRRPTGWLVLLASGGSVALGWLAVLVVLAVASVERW